MEFRSALPVAVLLGSVLGAGLGAGSTDPRAARPVAALVSEAEASTARWDIPVVRNAPVQRFVDLFTGKQADRMALYLKRSGRYEGMIRAKLRARGMPEDLVYLSMIESGFNPTARSHAKAVGLWQFIEDTGKRYGLRVDSYVDERRHPERSTDAALRYLGDLHEEFGAWYLAAAAYNTGENRVSRVMKEVTGNTKGSEADFWRIRHRLPAETREYVPLMLAAALIGKEPGKYGHGDVPRWLPVDTDRVKVPGGTRLATVAEAAGVGAREVERLNPHLVRKMTPPGESYEVAIPDGRAPQWAREFSRVREAAVAKEKAARAADVARRRDAERREAAVRAAAARRNANAGRLHTVRSGESLWTIARRNDTTVERIRSMNGLSRNATLRPGQKLRIPRAAPARSTARRRR